VSPTNGLAKGFGIFRVGKWLVMGLDSAMDFNQELGEISTIDPTA
jgi:hypothetical protein